MKHWCYYTRVVSYLEKLEALCAPNTKTAHFLVWTDDDGPHMIVGPGVEWYRGDGPMPELDGITAPAFPQTRNKGAVRVSKRSPSKRPIRTSRARKQAVTLEAANPRELPRRCDPRTLVRPRKGEQKA